MSCSEFQLSTDACRIESSRQSQSRCRSPRHRYDSLDVEENGSRYLPAFSDRRTSIDDHFLGGINDQLGKGFHRYSTDGRWHVPHFEKMLYDQGQIAVALADTYAVSPSE